MHINHGTFTLYDPGLPPEHPLVKAKALFLQNENGVDWYSIAHATPEPGRTFVMVREGRVVSLSPDPSTLWPIDSLLIETDEPVDQGWHWTGSTFVDPASISPSVNDLLDYLGRKRVAVEEGGIVLNGMTIATDRAVSQAKITAAWAKAKADPTFSIANWKVAPGVFVPLDNATIIAIGDAVTAHVQACFDKEAELAAAILADPPEITTYQEIDEADWPSNS